MRHMNDVAHIRVLGMQASACKIEDMHVEILSTLSILLYMQMADISLQYSHKSEEHGRGSRAHLGSDSYFSYTHKVSLFSTVW